MAVALARNLVATLALAVLVTACASEDATSPSPSPTLAAGATATADPSPTDDDVQAQVPAEFRDRDPDMTDDAAIARMGNPNTRELWLTRPQEIPTPAWARDDSLLSAGDTTWWELGRRGDATIVGAGFPVLDEFFEVAADGAPSWVAFPSPREASRPLDAPIFTSGLLVADPYTYYDTLALPSAFTLRTGEELLTPLEGWGVTSLPEETSEAESSEVMRVGPHAVLRFERPVAWVWSQAYDVSTPSGVTFTDFFYVLEAPYGMYIPLRYSPFGVLEDVDWDVGTEYNPGAYLADINDIACGPYDTDHNTLVTGVSQNSWQRIGTNTRDEPVYAPASSNPVKSPMYEVYRAAHSGQAVGVQRFTNAPALLGYFSRDMNGWVVYLNSEFSGRSWC